MPARTDTAAAPAAAASKPKFELPALDFQFKSLTDGTNIPAPLPSPVQEEPPPKPAAAKTAEKATTEETKTSAAAGPQANGASKLNGHHANTPSTITTITSGVKRPAEDIPSPTASNRPGSLRRLFSRNLLSSSYANGEAHSQGNTTTKTSDSFDAASSIAGSTRPESRSNGSFVDGKRTKRSSGWFSRFRSGGGDSSAKRASMVSHNNENKPPVVPAGPPPPMIPELDELKAKVDLKDDGSLGDDLFKNIK